MKLKSVFWYLGVIAAVAALVMAVLYGNGILSVCAFVLALVLRATNQYIPLPKIYAKLGVKNEVFEGKTPSK